MAYQQYQQLNTQIAEYITIRQTLDIRAQSQYEVLLNPSYENTPTTPRKLITTGREWERQQLWKTRTQIVHACMALQSCIEPVRRFNVEVAEMAGGLFVI